jgi:hypothetical protein
VKRSALSRTLAFIINQEGPAMQYMNFTRIIYYNIEISAAALPAEHTNFVITKADFLLGACVVRKVRNIPSSPAIREPQPVLYPRVDLKAAYPCLEAGLQAWTPKVRKTS